MKNIITSIFEKLKITNPSRNEKAGYILMLDSDDEVCAVPEAAFLSKVNKRIDGIVYPDGFTKTSDIVISGNEINIPAGDFEWKMELNPYKNVLFEQTIEETSDPAYNRIDSLAATKENTIVYHQGVEVDETEIAIPPIIPYGQLRLTDIYVLGSELSEPVPPAITEVFTKEEKDKLAVLDKTADIDKPVSTAQGAADADVLQEAKDYADTGGTAAVAAANAHTDSQVSNLINGEITYDTLKKLADEARAIRAIVGGTAPDGDSVINTVTELLVVMATFPEGVDMLTLIGSKVNSSDVYNALDCVVSGKVADARTVKTLNDTLVTLASTVAGKEDSSNKVTDIEGNKTNSGKFGDIPSWITWLKNSYVGNLAAKATSFVDGDLFLFGDLGDSSKTKTRTYAQLKADLKTYNDTLYAPISPIIVETGTSFTLENTYNGKILVLTASCTVTLPNGLASGFGITIVTLTGVTLTLSLGGSVTLYNNVGTTMAEKLSCTIQNRTATNQYITAGNL